MKQKIYKLFKFTFCIILAFVFVNNIVISNDSHVLECEQENCTKCLVIHNTKEILKSISFVGAIIFLYDYKRDINRINTSMLKIINTNLVLLKVQLNE